MNKKYSLLILLALLLPLGLQAQKPPQDMDRFLDNLLKRMTLEEKIGQLNLPVKSPPDKLKAATSPPR